MTLYMKYRNLNEFLLEVSCHDVIVSGSDDVWERHWKGEFFKELSHAIWCFFLDTSAKVFMLFKI